MSSALRRPATRDSHTKYFLVLADMNLDPVTSGSPYPPRLDWVARIDKAGSTVTSVMAPADFTASTAPFTTTPPYFQFPGTTVPTDRSTLLAGDILKDLGSVVHTYDNLGIPNPIHFATYRRVQLVAGGNTTSGSAQHVPVTIYSEGPWGFASNQYNTFWIRTWTSDPQWFRTAAIARMG